MVQVKCFGNRGAAGYEPENTINSVNRAADHVLGRRMIGAGISPPPESVADVSVDLKALLAAHATAG